MQGFGATLRSFCWKVWRIIRWPLGLLALYYVVSVVYVLFRLPAWSKAAVAQIEAQHLTMKDVDGSNLPPAPDQKLVDATVEGIDANHNGIRDDVELAIFKKYPTDIKLRAAALQYAMTEQWFLSPKIIDKPSWKAAAEQDARADACLADTYAYTTPSDHYRVISDRADFVENLVFNNDRRKAARESVDAHTTSFGTASGATCDVQI